MPQRKKHFTVVAQYEATQQVYVEHVLAYDAINAAQVGRDGAESSIRVISVFRGHLIDAYAPYNLEAGV